jgi:lambda family phage tail tape measure protein
MAGISADIDRMGKSYGEVANDIKKATLASNGSIRSLEAQRNSWASLRAGLDPASKGYREVGREIDKVDKRLARLNKRRGFSAKGAAQTVGAVASAGIFGGPLGAAGALGGAAIGGAAGAAVGGGIGASVGILAQQVSGFTDYAASIRLSEKALKRLITVEGESSKARIQTAKNEAVATQVIEYAVAKLNVERADATIGMTRLSAAVLGAGGNIETAGLAFLGATKAIKATKGSAEDVRGGLTALVQMFSKGKISAEELSGQLGERFPAAVTAFADANDISTQELQKMLKNGEVGLDKLVNFLQFAVKKYSDGALEMAASSEESGQRQTIAFQEVRRQLGEQLVTVGSELQQSITKALKDLTPAIVNIAKATAQGIKTIINGIALLITHFDKIKDVIIILVGATAGAKALVLITTISARIIPLIARVGLLKTAILFLNRALMLNPYYALAAGITAAGVAINNHINRHDRFIDSVARGSTSVDDAKKKLTEYGKEAARINTKLNSLPVPKAPQKPTATAIGVIGTRSMSDPSGMQSIGEMQIPQMPADPFASDRAQLQSQLREINKARTGLEKAISDRVELESLPASMQDLLKQLMEGSTIPGLDLDPSGDGTGDEKVKMTQAELGLRRQLRTAQASQNELLAAEVQLAIDSLAAKAETEDLVKATNMEEQANATYAKAVNDIYKKRNELMQSANVEMQNARFAVTLMSQEERQRIEINRQLAEFAEKYAGAMSSEELANALRELRSNLEEANSAAFKFKKGLREIFNEAINVTESISELGVSAVEGLGDAFAEFVTTGKANFRDFANSVISDLARIFAKKALFGALGAIPGVGSFLGLGGGGSGGDELNIEGIQAYMNANGNVFAKNKIVPYAYGGIVNKPTLFPMANGAGLMGEAGPEAIMPLRRGANGKLGVEASGGASNVVVNVDASGSSVEGNGDQAAQLGKAIGIAVQQELIKQKRPGGLLTS